MEQQVQLISASPSNLRWHQGLDRYCWVVLIIAALGWLFDTMDQNLFNLVRVASLRELLSSQYSGQELSDQVKWCGGIVMAAFIIGWASGGFIFGILGDRIGRTRTMILTILTYAVFTGMSGFAHSVWFYGFSRFMTGMGVGGEWAAGAALVAETFPARSRTMALGLLQALSTVGNMAASIITMIIGDQTTGRFELFGIVWSGWRIAFLVGAVPALLVLWIRRSVKEPPEWVQLKSDTSGARRLGRLTDLFRNKTLLRHTIAGCLLVTAGVGVLWGVGNFSIDHVRPQLVSLKLSEKQIGQFISGMFLLQQVGAFIGIYLFAVIAERIGRRPTFIAYFVLAFASVAAFFWGVNNAGETVRVRALLLAPLLGFGTLGPFSGYSLYLPELFPTRLRSTGAGFCYNAARYLAAIAPILLGTWAARVGYAQAATIVSSIVVLGIIGALIGPETRGKPLPDDADLEPAVQGLPVR